MKKITIAISLLLCICISAGAQSWLKKIGEKVKEKVVEKVEQRIEDKTEEATEKALNKSEDAIKSGVKKQKGKTTSNSATVNSKQMDVSYTKYDFVPGNEVVFEDDLIGEQKGEFPSKWDLIEGNAEIAQIDGENVLATVGYTYITPLFKNKAYKLPDEFTLEFDIYIDNNEGEVNVDLMNNSGETILQSVFWKESERFLFHWDITTNERTSEDTYSNSAGWHHYALSFNKRAVKVYMDSKRVVNVPNVPDKPTKMKFFARGGDDKSNCFIKNIRIAKGAVPLYDRLMTDGKIVTYGITFEVGKATIKPQSMGTINEICDMMQKHPALKFRVEGHTDNTGNASLNQTLSESRAKAVRDKLIQMGIDGNRLTSKGYGMSKPVDSNNTPEGKAKNRRVEFVKQ